MASKAVYGALMGLGEGISGYGKSLTLEELRKQEDERTFSRQHSLQEIKQRYQKQVIAEKRTYDEGREMEGLTPGTDLYDKKEAQRQIERGEKTKDAISVAEARAAVYSGGSSGVMGRFNMSQWTPESGQEFMAEVNRLVESGMSPQEAQRVASGTIDLVPKPQSTSSDSAGMNSTIDDELALFLSQPKELKVAALIELLGEESRGQLEAMSVSDLIEAYKTQLYQVFARRQTDPTPKPMGLMQPGGQDGAGDPLNLRGGNQ